MLRYRTAFLIAALMFAASIGADIARPDAKAANRNPGPLLSLENMIPKQFGEWREEPSVQVVSPAIRATLDKLYSETLTRTYANSLGGYRIMISLAYGHDQRADLQAHKPENCYLYNGFTLHKSEPGQIVTRFGNISVQRLYTSRGSRVEPVSYWFKFGDASVSGDEATRKLKARLAELRYNLTGRIPDGLLFRVSSIDSDQTRANDMQDRFINDLLQAVSAMERKHLTGIDNS